MIGSVITLKTNEKEYLISLKPMGGRDVIHWSVETTLHPETNHGIT